MSRAARILSAMNRLLSRADVAIVRASSTRSGNAAPAHFGTARVDAHVCTDANAFIHDLRTQRLRSMPGGADVVLSAGCSGTWYFDWLDGAYPGIERHIGLEAYVPRPPDLSDRVVWIAESVGSMTGVADASVDLVFSGQNIEHLWAADVVGFLLESHRVLHDGGWLVIDSPNGTICDAMNYLMPEHVAELSPGEIAELLRLAGFADITVRGVWLCFDRERQLLLPLEPNRVLAGWTHERRAALAADRPEDSFIWWAEARRSGPPQTDALVDAVERIVSARYRRRLVNPIAPTGRLMGRGQRRTCSVDRGVSGVVLRGPRAPLPPGRHRLRFELRSAPIGSDAPVAVVEAYSETTERVLASRSVHANELASDRLTPIELDVTLPTAAFGVEFRVRSTGAVALTTALTVEAVLGPSVPFHANEFA